VRCQISEFPIWPSGTPTAFPEALSEACGALKSALKVGVCARVIAFSSLVAVLIQNPSRMMRVSLGIEVV